MGSDTYWGLTDPALIPLQGVERWYYFRQRLWERDNGHCGMCGEPLLFAEMDADHIVPRAEGGLTRWDNLRATHYDCNRSAGGQLGLQRRTRPPVGPTVAFVLRLPPDLHTALKGFANADDRSLNWVIVRALEAGIARHTKTGDE